MDLMRYRGRCHPQLNVDLLLLCLTLIACDGCPQRQEMGPHGNLVIMSKKHFYDANKLKIYKTRWGMTYTVLL